jgi:hypothetical protein
MQYIVDHEITPQFYQGFLAQFEGVEGISDNDMGEIEQCLMEMGIETEY